MKLFRKLLFPFALIYGAITMLRNFLYDQGWLKSKSYNLPVICVGNLSTGGTGKSPMIELLVSYLMDNYNIAVLSRGYKRKTKGFKEVLIASSVEEVGDEPSQFKHKFPQIKVAVCEDRQEGIEKLQETAEIVLLDDAFQHRKVRASLYILLTPFNDLYINDCVLPAGNLREPRFGATRANIIVVTKCPDNMDLSKMESIRRQLKPKSIQQVYFSKIGYSSTIMNEKVTRPLTYLKNQRFLLVTGIAKPEPLITYLQSEEMDFEIKSFPDHHNFSKSELEQLATYELILTTEKDYTRLRTLNDRMEIYYLPIQTVILDDTNSNFKKRILNEVKRNS